LYYDHPFYLPKHLDYPILVVGTASEISP
jgi:hypothetical protein